MRRPWNQSETRRVTITSDIRPLWLEKLYNFFILNLLLWHYFTQWIDLNNLTAWPQIMKSIVLNYEKALESIWDKASHHYNWYSTSLSRKLTKFCHFEPPSLTLFYAMNRLKRTTESTWWNQSSSTIRRPWNQSMTRGVSINSDIRPLWLENLYNFVILNLLL